MSYFNKKVIRNIFIFCYFFICIEQISFAQNLEIPRDNYFTTEKVFQKLVKTYPFIEKPDTVLPIDIRVIRNVTYKIINERELKADVFMPSIAIGKLLPCVLIYHGGGWRSGSKEMEHPFAAQLAKHGIVAVTVEYRLSPEAKYPAAVLDAKTSIRWIRKNSSIYHVDTSKIYLLGASAGALLATLAGVTPNSPIYPSNDQFIESDGVAGVINIDGEVDFSHPDAYDLGSDINKPSSATKWFSGNFLQLPHLWKEASPVNYVSEKTPPIFFINSSIPENHAGQEKMLVLLKKHNILSSVKTFDNTPHPFWLFNPWFKSVVNYVVVLISEFSIRKEKKSN